MKKLALVLTWILVVSFLVGAAACGGGATPTPQPTTTPQPTVRPTATPTPPPSATPIPTATAAATATPTVRPTAAPSLAPSPTPTPTPTPAGGLPTIAVQTWKVSHAYPTTSVRGLSAAKFEELVEKYTNGSIKIDIFPSGTLFSAAQSLQAVTTGSVDVTWDPPYFQTSVVPYYDLIYVPGIWAGVEHGDRVFKSDQWNNKTRELFLAKGIQFLGMVHESLSSGFVNNKVKATDLPDFKGLKFGLRSGTNPVPTTEYGGMTNVSIASADANAAFQQGIFDVLATGINTIVDGKWWEVAKYALFVPMGPQATSVVVNKSKWDKLPVEYQKLITDKVMPEVWDFARALMLEKEKTAIETAKKNFQFVGVVTSEQMTAAWAVMKNYDVTKRLLEKSGADIVKLIDDLR